MRSHAARPLLAVVRGEALVSPAPSPTTALGQRSPPAPMLQLQRGARDSHPSPDFDPQRVSPDVSGCRWVLAAGLGKQRV